MQPSDSQANECIRYQKGLRAVAAKISATSRPLGHLSASLRTMVERWSSQTDRLNNSLDAVRGVCSDFDGSSIVFQILTLGFRETIALLEALLEETSGVLSQSKMEELSERVVLHLAATGLMSLYLERECLRHRPNARMEINKWDDKWIEQKARLEARLRAFFGCSSFALTLEGLVAGHEDSVDPSKQQGNLLEETPYSKHPLLTVLHLEMGEIISDASHNAQLNILLRIAIYSIAKLRELPKNLNPEGMTDSQLAKPSVVIHKVAWVVHVLAGCAQSRRSNVGFRQVVGLILEELTQLFAPFSRDQFTSPALDLLDHGLFVIKDPLRGLRLTAQVEVALYDQSLQKVDSGLAKSPGPRDSAPNQSPHSIVLSTAPEDMPNQIHGVHEFDQTGIGENKTDTVQTLPQLADIRRDELSHFPLIESITLVEKKTSRETRYNRPTAQMWMARSEPAKVTPRPTIKAPRAPASESTLSNEQPPLITLDTECNTFKVLLFCESFVFATSVTDELRSTNEVPNTIVLQSKMGKGGCIYLYELQGGPKKCAGLKMNRFALEPWNLPASCKRAYAQVQMTFPNTEAREEFSKALQLGLEHWLKTWSKVRSQRETQRSPIIEPKSKFRYI